MEPLPFGDFDVVVVGAGTAGCVLANRLSANPKLRVLLLEAGGSDRQIRVRVPVGYLYCMGHPRTDWGFKTAPEIHLNGRALDYPRGRVLGGCSSINGMIYMRGQARDYDGWRQRGLEGWGWEDVLPYFKRSEDHYGGADKMHGVGGELRVEEQRLHWDILDAFRDAAERVGIPKTDDFNRGDNFGSGYFRVNQKRGLRWNASSAFLKPVVRRSNLRVATHAHVNRVRFDGTRASGVEFMRGGRLYFARASSEVILAAGAVGSPHLLQLSGVGNADALHGMGIPVVAPSPDVGENLQDHLQIRCVYRLTDAATLNERMNTLFGKAAIGLEYLLRRSGPMSMAPSQLGIFAKSDASIDDADLQYHVQPLSLDRFGEPLHSFPAVTASVCHLRPDSRGWVRLASPDPRAAPVIKPNYLSAPRDRAVAVRAIKLTRRIMAQAPLAQYQPAELRPGPLCQTDAELLHATGDIATTIFHSAGTARMGSDERSVVDGRLRVRGVQGLRVADASIMPAITSGNTNAPTTMIAEKASDMILGDLRRG